MGGAINVVLKKGSGIRNNITAAVSYGSFNTLQSDVSGAYRNKKSGLTFRGSAFQAYTDNNYKIWGRFVRLEMPNGRMEPIETRRFNDAFRTFGGRFEIGFTDVKWADNAMLGYNGSDAYNEIQHGQYMTRPYKGRFTESQAHVFSLNYAKRDLFTKGLQLTFNGVYSDRDQYVQDTVTYNYTWLGELHRGLRFNNDGSVDTVPTRSPFGAQQGTPTMANINRKIINLRSNLNYDITPNHRLVFNHVFYTVDREDTDALRTVLDMSYRATNDLNKHVFSFAHEMNAFDQRLKTNLFGKFYQQQIDRINPYQATVNGVSTRVIDTIRNTKTTTGFGLAVSYAITPTIILIGSGERAVRMPAEGEIFGGPAENVTANPALRPEISDNLNLGVRLGTFNINRHHLSVGFSGFVRNTKDQIMQRTDDRLNEATQTSPFVNLGKAQAIGFEAEMNYVYHQKLNFNFNISKFNSLFKMRETVHYNKQVPNLPFFTMNGTAQYHIDHVLQQKSRLNLYYNFGYVDSFNITWDEVPYSRTPTQFIQDFGASYMFPNSRFLVSVDVKNFTNRAAFDNFAVQKPGRAFYLKLNYTINHF
ncbi:Outer membrane receptor proteins, mostly Fe transport [Parapedobacter composti]|uniref:Outer membrane receptor proteins, mostly Fe transport n=1 Tax=Parapedobacter composti TaxID=623281 RepID=A0A1I1JZ03_9SPHI|nr:Outer membrane receptor proteins, mostly Fe transport [Parapedobacter composti]